MNEPVRALVLGGVAWNTMVYLDRFPDPEPQTLFTRGYHETVGSSGAGKALNLKYLGADVTLWAMVGEDDPGRRVTSHLRRAGIRFVAAPDPTGTTRHINLMDRTGERISIFANAGSPSLSVPPEAVEELLAGIDLLAVTIVDACRALLPVLRAAGVGFWCDLHDYDETNPYYRDFVEAATHLQITSNRLTDWRGFMQRRIEAGTESVVCTHGSDGASGLTADEGWVDVPAATLRNRDVVDTNGAGDGFFAGFAMARHAGADLATAMRRGASHAAEVVQSRELSPPQPGSFAD